MGPATAETRAAQTAPSISASRSRRGGACASLRPACQLPRVPTSRTLPGPHSQPETARATATSLLSFGDPLPVGRPQPPRHVPASGTWGSLVHHSHGGPAGKPGATQGTQTAVKGVIHSPEGLEVMSWLLTAGGLHLQRWGRWWW